MKSNSEDENSLFSLRNLIFFIMMTAISLAIYFGAQSKHAEAEKLDDLVQKTSNFQMRVLLAQVLIKPEADQKLHVEQVQFLFETLEGNVLTNAESLSVQKYVIMKFLGENPSFPETSAGVLKNELKLLYEDSKSLNEETSPLFKLPAGDLARLHQYKLEGRTEDYNLLLNRLTRESEDLLVKMQVVFFAISSLFGIGIFILYSFFKKQKFSLFLPVIEMIPGVHHKLLLESVILHLFLIFPVAAYIFISYPGLDPVIFNVVFIPAAFVISILYYLKNSGRDGYLKELLFGISSPNVFKEFYYGVMGFLGIFPVAMLSMFLGFGIFDGPDVRFAHPIVFVIKDHPGMVFFLAVVVAPVTEEIIFRSFLFGFFRSRLRLFHAAMLTGMIFAVLHPQGMNAFFYLMVIGGGLAVLREYRNGLIAPMTAHMIINLTATVIAYSYMVP